MAHNARSLASGELNQRLVAKVATDFYVSRKAGRFPKRNALYQVVQQLEANKAAQAEQSAIAVPVAPMPGRKMN
jgi:hypothetical protein